MLCYHILNKFSDTLYIKSLLVAGNINVREPLIILPKCSKANIAAYMVRNYGDPHATCRTRSYFQLKTFQVALFDVIRNEF